jgi:hypothetical protein
MNKPKILLKHLQHLSSIYLSPDVSDNHERVLDCLFYNLHFARNELRCPDIFGAHFRIPGGSQLFQQISANKYRRTDSFQEKPEV